MTPIIKVQDGVSIYIFSRDHLPPHIHISYSGDEAIVEIRTGEKLKGEFPPRKLRIVQEWLEEEGVREKVEEIFYQLNPRLRP